MSENESDLTAYDQMRAIRDEIAREEPLVSDILSIDVLRDELKSNPTQAEQISLISRTYPSFRRIRRDGDCFYRAFLLGLFEWCTAEANRTAAEQLMTRLKVSVEQLGKYHVPMIIADFWDVFEELLTWVMNDRPSTAELVERLSDQGNACYTITLARLLTSLRLRESAETFTYFIPEGVDMHTFVTQSVEPLGQEADHVQLVALAQETGVKLRVIYLDRLSRAGTGQSDVDASTNFSFEDIDGGDNGIYITLLYRPGHYDLLYK